MKKLQSQIINLGRSRKTYNEFLEFYGELQQNFKYDIFKSNCRHLSICCLDFLRPEIDGRPMLRLMNKHLDKLQLVKVILCSVLAANAKPLFESLTRIYFEGIRFYNERLAHLQWMTCEETFYQMLFDLSERYNLWPTIQIRVWERQVKTSFTKSFSKSTEKKI